MSALTYDAAYTESRNRLTTAFRWLLAIPHLIVAGLWSYVAELLAVIQWFIVLFTGARNQGIWDMQRSYLDYYGRVSGYASLLYDEYPAFGTDPGRVPVRTDFDRQDRPNRLTNALRIIWAIPAFLLLIAVTIAMFFVAVASWFAIVITGRHPRGMFDFLLNGLRYTLQVNSYSYLMTDTYPKWGDQGPAPAELPGGPPASTLEPPSAHGAPPYGHTAPTQQPAQPNQPGQPLPPPAP